MSEVKIEFTPKNIPFRRLGPSGLRVPLFSLGGWLTLGGSVQGDPIKEIIKVAFENGINMFDLAEGYQGGRAEIEMGRVFRELGFRRSDIIVTTKFFWGNHQTPNDTGLSRKHIIEGVKDSLARTGLDYFDVVFAHRADQSTPIEETVRAFNWIIEQGWAFYWATSEWSGQEIEEAHHIADKLGLIAPVAEQVEHHFFRRERAEHEYWPLYRKYSTSTTIFSPLAGGLLTGKYNNGIPSGSRLAVEKEQQFQDTASMLQTTEGKQMIEKIKALTALAEDELGCKISQLALAWIAANPNTSSVILGASRPEQVLDNLKALDVIPKLTPEVLDKIEAIVANKPAPWPTHGRPALDSYGRQ